MSFKRAKVMLIPTKKSNMCKRINQENNSSDILIQPNKDAFKDDVSWGFHIQPFELYIISNEKPKINDWTLISLGGNYSLSQLKEKESGGLKIIATTDKSLTIQHQTSQGNLYNEPLPQPSQAFIEKYVEQYNKGNQITDILVEYEENYTDGFTKDRIRRFYDKPMLKVSKDNTITIKKVKDSWSREEVIDLIIKLIADSHFTDDREALIYIEDYGDDGFSDYHLGNGFKKWIEENL